MHSVLALEGRVSLAFGIGIGNAAVAAQDLPTHAAWRTPRQAIDTAVAGSRGAMPLVTDAPPPQWMQMDLGRCPEADW
jgi:hypothetical protein